MSENHPSSHDALPDQLQKQLESYQAHLWRRKCLELSALLSIGFIVSFLLIFGLDRCFQTPMWLRLIIFTAGLSILGLGVPLWIHRWIWGHRQKDQLARLISQQEPQLGDKLLGIIELQNQLQSDDGSSARLRQAAILAVAKEAASYPLLEALPPSPHRRWILVASIFSLAGILPFYLFPNASSNALERWLKPLSPVERYTFTRLENPTKRLFVPYGEPFEVLLKLSPKSSQRPEIGYASLGELPTLETKLHGDAYHFAFTGQQEPNEIDFRIGDKTHRLEILPLPRPSPLQTLIHVTPPPYMKLPEYSQHLSSGEIHLVEGSQIAIEMQMNRAIHSGTYGPSKALSSEEKNHVIQGNLKISGKLIRTPPIPIRLGSLSLPFSWTDEYSLTSTLGYELNVEGLKDLAPRITVPDLLPQKALLPEESFDFEIHAQDDFGLKHVGLEWRSMPSEKNQEAKHLGEVILQTGKPQELRSLVPTIFSPKVFQIEPQLIELRAFTEDTFPQRGRIYSPPFKLHILSREEHQQLLSDQYQKTINELEDLARREMNLLDENHALSQLNPDSFLEESARKKIAAQHIAEIESLERMKKNQENLERILDGAIRNGQIPKPILRQMADALKAIQEFTDTDIPKVRDELGEASQAPYPTAKTQKNLENAIKSQTTLVEKMRESIEKAKLVHERFEASTLVTRLEKASRDQKLILRSILDSFSRNMLGLKVDELIPSDRFQLNDSAEQQSRVAADLRWMQEDLGYYFQRTKNPIFQKMEKTIQSSTIHQSLEKNREELLQNHSYAAGKSAKFWVEELQRWADSLGEELEGSRSTGEGGQGGESPDAEDDDFEFMLRVMKMVQNQQELRSRTRVFEQLQRQETPSN